MNRPNVEALERLIDERLPCTAPTKCIGGTGKDSDKVCMSCTARVAVKLLGDYIRYLEGQPVDEGVSS